MGRRKAVSLVANTRNSSTRSEIVNMLKVHGSLTVSEMATQLKITEMAVRRHLNTLERDNLINSRMVRQSMGRPTSVYSLTESAEELFPQHYSDFALDVLQDIHAHGGEETIKSLFQRREERMSNLYRKEVKGDTLEEKVEELARLQNSRGYMVEIDKDPQTGDIIFKEYNCPISQVAKEFSHACDCELSLFKKVLKTDVEQRDCISKGEEKCVYVIKNNDKR
ncbi:MAG TPA: metalloregulator ArsR/SmtB family transcription factor [Bacillota bacterium]|nr:metalloregulator ArsR/SmtB family transcription factor [Bacillota bacterium]